MFFWRPAEPRSPEPEGDPVSLDLDPESQKVYDWRLGSLLKAGLDFPAADLLASSNEDLHLILKAIKNGCDPERLLKVFA